MQVNSLAILQRANAGLAASDANDLVRLNELNEALSGTAPRVHRHVTGDIDGLSAAIAAGLGSGLVDSVSVTWAPSGTGYAAFVDVKPSGGLKIGAQGLYVDSGTVSVPGHTHLASEIRDFATAVLSQLEGDLVNSVTVTWAPSGTGYSALVQVQPAGGLKVTTQGLAADVGTGSTQVAAGDHTHTLLHTPASAAPSSTIALAVDPITQVVSTEVELEPAGGLLVQPSGVGVDFGTGHNQAARGDHTHTGLQGQLTVVSTATLALTLDGSNELSGTVRLESAPGADRGFLDVGVNGLEVVLGSGTNVAAPGDHTHAAATVDRDGFMSAGDKATLLALSGAGTSGTPDGKLIVLDGAGSPIPTGTYLHFVMPYSGTITGWDLVVQPSGTLAVDIYQGPFSAIPLGVGDSITGADKPTVSGTAAQNVTVAWGFGTGDAFALHVDSCAYVTRASLGLRIRR